MNDPGTGLLMSTKMEPRTKTKTSVRAEVVEAGFEYEVRKIEKEYELLWVEMVVC